MNNSYEINKSRVQQFGLTATIKDDDGKEHYFYRGYEYVEIGGLKWAVTNIGAEKETDSGLYFAFGETQGYTVEQVNSRQKFFGWADYKYGNRSSLNTVSMTKYNETDHKTVLEACDDAAQVAWGGSWRMPTETEFQSLLSLATYEWAKDYQGSGVNGMLFTDITDSSKKLFFPAAGFCFYSDVEYDDYYGYYWSSSLLTHHVADGIDFNFSRGYSSTVSDKRYFGFSVRGVVGD